MLNLITIFYLIVQTAVLQVHVEKVEGELYIAIFESEDRYMDDPSWELVEKVDQKTMKVGLPFEKGTYAIAVFQDMNGNGQLDTNWMGVPSEPYGFSKDARGSFGPPGFDQASIIFDGSPRLFNVTLW